MAKKNESASEKDRTPESELTEAEWAIMKVIWREGSCAAGTVQEALQSSQGWAYSTVKTLMDRMVKKGVLGTYRIRNLQLFTANITRTQACRGEIFKAIKRAFDGAMAPMMRFVLENEKLSEEELRGLREMIDKSQRQDEEREA